MSTCALRQFVFRNKTKVIFVVLLICLGWILYHYLTRSGLSSLKKMQCSRTESVAMIEAICSQYSKGKIIGNLCPSMCNKGDIVFKRCLNNRRGKHVLLVNCYDSCEKGKTVQAVLKMSKNKDLTKHLKSIDRELLEIFPYSRVFDSNVHLLDYLIDQKYLVHKLQEMLNDDYSYKLKEDEDLLMTLWGADYIKSLEMNDDNPSYSIKFVRTLWSLLAQNEYKLSVVFQDLKIFPKIHRFCGPLYLSDYNPFNERLDRRVEHSQQILWRKRVTMAVHILNLVQSVEDTPMPLHFCDMKTPHFGLTTDGEIRFIDSDTVFTNDTMNMIFKTVSCKLDKDCAFFNCLGACNMKSGLCEPYRINNNLQSVCSQILQDGKTQVYEGILATPPYSVADKLQGLLNECINGITSHIGKVAIRKPSEDLLSKIRNTLLDSMD